MLHTPESVLMDRAAAAVAGEASGAERVVALVGRGNNGGDALLACALLAGRGAAVTAVLLAPDAHPRGLASLTEAGGRVIEWDIDAERCARPTSRMQISLLTEFLDLVDRAGCVPLRKSAVAAITPGTTVIAVDLPSGLNPDSGDASAPHITADTTVTFTAPKLCLTLKPAAASAGRVVIVDVGVDV